MKMVWHGNSTCSDRCDFSRWESVMKMVVLVLYVWWQVWFFALDDVGLAFIHWTQRGVIFPPEPTWASYFIFVCCYQPWWCMICLACSHNFAFVSTLEPIPEVVRIMSAPPHQSQQSGPHYNHTNTNGCIFNVNGGGTPKYSTDYE